MSGVREERKGRGSWLTITTAPCVMDLYNDFLADCPQRVSVQGIMSDEVILNTGVKQGCVLSPALFSMYINEM